MHRSARVTVTCGGLWHHGTGSAGRWQRRPARLCRLLVCAGASAGELASALCNEVDLEQSRGQMQVLYRCSAAISGGGASTSEKAASPDQSRSDGGVMPSRSQ